MTEFLPAAPVLLVLFGATVSVVLEGLLPRLVRSTVQFAWTLVILLGALCLTIWQWATAQAPMMAAMDVIVVDAPSWASWTLLLMFAAMATFLFAERRVGGGDSPFAASVSATPASSAEREAIAARQEHAEVFPLLLFAVAGMMLFVAANDLLLTFVALEIFSFPLYILAGMARRRRLLSQEASLKYFLLGALSSAIFLYGIALTYGYAGAFGYADIDLAIQAQTQSPWLLLIGMALMLVGVLFKLGAVPFHSWVPDVYTGSPTPVTGFMAICTKLAAAIGMLRLLYAPLGALRWDWQMAVAVVAVLTMIVGATVGLRQTDVKRLLAYSSIAHAGFILVGVAGATTIAMGEVPGFVSTVDATLFYLAAYGFATLGAFAILTVVRRSGTEATSFEAWAGLGRRNPMLAVFMTIFLLSMAGIPLTGGFIGKLLVFIAAWRGGMPVLVLLAVLFSLVAAGFYFRVVWVMFGKEPSEQTAILAPGRGTWLVIFLAIVGTFVLGLAPGLVANLPMMTVGFVR